MLVLTINFSYFKKKKGCTHTMYNIVLLCIMPEYTLEVEGL